MNRPLKVIGSIFISAILVGIALGFYFSLWTLAFGLISLLILVLSVWSTMIQTNNSVYLYRESMKGKSAAANDIERYSR